MKKFSKNYLYYHFVADIFITLVVAFAFMDALILEDEAGNMLGWDLRALPFFILAMVAVYAVLILYRVLYLRFASYTLTENDVRVTRGVLFRKNSILEYCKMHAINKKQNIIQRLFGLAVITVDSGSANTAMTSEILIYEASAEADRLMAFLKAKKNGESVAEAQAPAEEVLCAEGGDLVLSSGKKLIYSLLNIASAALGTLTVIVLALVAYFCLVPVLYKLFAGEIFFVLVPALIVCLIVTVGISLFTFLVSILQSFIGFYNFRIRKTAKDLEISYGLLTRHENSFGFDRIQGVVIRQGLIQRLFGYATLTLEVIGYHEGGEDQQNKGVSMVGMLLPLCRAQEAAEILASLLPAYVPMEKKTRAVRYFPFISWSTLLIFSISALSAIPTLSLMYLLDAPAIALSIVSVLLAIGFAIAVGLRAFGAFLAYKTAGIAISEDRITVYGGGYQKRITTLMRRSLIAVEDVTTPLRARAGIYTLILHLRANALDNEVKVEMLDREAAEQLLSVLPD